MKFLREPLVHFLIIGAALFVVSGFVDGPRQGEDKVIVIDEGQVQRLVEGWKATWRRPPTQEELTGLVDDYITEEVLYREALALGLERGDMVIRRRLRQKMEFISEDFAAQLQPTEKDLQSYLEENREYFIIEPEMTFAHIYLNPDKRQDSIQRDSTRLLTQLGKGSVQATNLGDPFPLRNEFVNASLTKVMKNFGADFADAVKDIPVAKWTGPVRSGYGFHLVLVRERTDGRIPELDEVRDLVVREWTAARRREMKESFVQRLREQYTITLDLPEPSGESAETAAETG